MENSTTNLLAPHTANPALMESMIINVDAFAQLNTEEKGALISALEEMINTLRNRFREEDRGTMHPAHRYEILQAKLNQAYEASL